MAIQTPKTPNSKYTPKTKLKPTLNIHMDVIERNIGNLTSLAARKEFVKVNAIGQIEHTQMLWKNSSCFAMLADCSDRLYVPMKRFEKVHSIADINQMAT